MSKLREVKKRIRSVNNIAQVTRAMQLVAASRMKKAQERAENGKIYASKIKEIMFKLAHTSKNEIKSDWFTVSSNEKILIILFSPKRGLAGSLPPNTMRFTLKLARDFGSENLSFIVIGRKLASQIAKSGLNLIADFAELPEVPTTADIRPVLKMVEDSFLSGEYGKVILVYPKFINPLVQKPMAQVLLPLDMNQLTTVGEELNVSLAESTYNFEPSIDQILNELIPSYLESQIYQAYLETVASEYSARMVAMKAASDNAKDIKENLTLEFNKSRQAQITRELAEITGGRLVLSA